MAWLYLIIAGMFEVGFASLLKLSEGLTRIWPTLGFLGLGCLSLWFLQLAMRSIPLGTAYAVWTGIGAFGTALVGIIFFRDPLTFWRMVFLAMLLIAVIGLQLVTPHERGVN